ncbi:anaphase promoting complex subunit 1 [Boletus reticuloceps]|uniref:Anaphase promoting complex subunit 1 n=1 Tax=Boletus reticuloceps TaxID=495285 RepID=A0A8I3A8J1_9AGAM|nr:anaphase promoting complex subunit 1 [Boletus reticuloceps]
MDSNSIVIRVHADAPSAAVKLLSHRTSRASEPQVEESALLRSIRSALRGSASNSINAVYAPLYDDRCDAWAEQELAWNDRCVVLSHGGVIQRKWDFSDEDQTIQRACLGRFAYSTNTTGPVHGSAHYTSKPSEQQADPSAESVFGPFKTTQEERQKNKHAQEEVAAVFVFLRSIGKVYLINGIDYTFSLPFLVRNAWPLHPHGVMIQRHLDPMEIDDSRATGDAPLPTTFTITNPFSEPAAVGITAGIVGGFPGRPACLSDEEENYSRPLVVIPAVEEVVWVSRKPFAIDDILITFNSERQELSIWRYVYQPCRRTSPSRFDLSFNLDRMALGSDGEGGAMTTAAEHGRMKASFWAQRLITHPYPGVSQGSLSQISAALFDQRFDGVRDHTLLAICTSGVPTAVFLLSVQEANKTVACEYLTTIDAVSVVPIGGTRKEIWDLLAVKSDGSLTIFTHGLQQLPVVLGIAQAGSVGHAEKDALVPVTGITSIKSTCVSSVTLLCTRGQAYRGKFDMLPRDPLVNQALQALSLVVPTKDAFTLHLEFLRTWSLRNFCTSSNLEFHAFSYALTKVLDLGMSCPANRYASFSVDWEQFFSLSVTVRNFQDDPALQHLSLPTHLKTRQFTLVATKPSPLLAPVLYALHMLAEDLRLVVHRHDSLVLLVPLVCQIAHIIRPEWADYWKRLCPNVMPAWPASSTTRVETLDDRIPVWPPDMAAILYGRISNPDWKFPVYETPRLAAMFDIQPSYAFGKVEPLGSLQRLTTAYLCLSDGSTASAQKRAEMTVETLVRMWGTAKKGQLFLDSLPLGIAAPLREAIRTCQLSPPSHWQPEHYELIDRRDLAFSVAMVQPVISQQGIYQSAETYMTSHRRTNISTLVEQAKAASAGTIDALSGVELGLKSFASIRFGQDRRLEEVARMLCSSMIPSVRLIERPDLNEHDQAKEQQHQVVRIAERTLALPYGRAMFTFGSVLTVTREAYVIPKLEYQIRIQPSNVIIGPEPGKIPLECTNWGEFHNGVAAGLRVAPWARGVESSWIAFNKPSELTPEHAGFLYGLGLTGHLKEMLTWHTFGYLTPKHDLTSIGVLLGLSAANVGSGNMHVTKLIAVHTPALLPTPTVDLNVSLMTQAAGLAGVGLLYLGTKDRRMAEVCLNQISRKDLVQPDLSNEHREAYTYSAALAFGMIMLGKGSPIPADVVCLHRLRVLIHGEMKTNITGGRRPTFDVNITSPAATMALGLMYMKTEQKDVADILELPSTVIELNRIQPSFLVMRTIARSLIMWNSIGSTADWLMSQIPEPIMTTMQDHIANKQRADDAIELAYFNIIAGYCFAVGLKYAGTARHEAYIMLSNYFDTYSRFVATSGPAFDHKIKRSAMREGLNLISIALCMVMAGTGEISCLRRLRYAFGMYHQAFRYGVHVATHLSLGLLFLGAGRFTLGTSNAAIACMVTSFFPRFHHVSSDNKSYLQALRHLWVLAVEPRCLIARDVTTREAVYLPVKITTREGNGKGVTQLISPTLIPDFEKLVSVRIDTPRYWPFFVDFENVPEHKMSFLRNQTLYVKRRTAFLSYTEDPRGSRSLFVRSGSSAGDAAILDFPQLTDAKAHPASDLTHFISSFSNDTLFLAFADYFSRDDGETPEERTFHAYCHAALLDSILQDKMETLQSHLTLYQYRTQPQSTSHFHLRLQDLRFAVDFYSKVFDRRFSGRAENNPRPPLIRENTVSGALQVLDERLWRVQNHPKFIKVLGHYARGEPVFDGTETGTETAYEPSAQGQLSRWLAWYLMRNGVPSASLLVILRQLAREAHVHSMSRPPPEGTANLQTLDVGIKEVLRGTGTKMINAFGSGWSGASLDRIVEAWQGVS